MMQLSLTILSSLGKQLRCLLFVFICVGVFLFTTNTIFAATLLVSPATGVHAVGSTFAAQVRLNTQGQPVNASEGNLKFDPQKIQVLSVSKGPIFSLWTTDPTFSNSAGTIAFGGGSPTGYTGAAGIIATINFRVVSAGTTNVTFTSGSALAADGRGTNVLTSMGSAAFTLAAADVQAVPEAIEYVAPPNTPSAPVITSTTHQDSSRWYANQTAELSWSLPSGIVAVRTLLDGNPSSVPTRVYDDPISSISLSDLPEGVSYFHLQFRNADGWGRVAHYRLAVDTKKPTRFDIRLPEQADLSEPIQTLILDVDDETSRVRRFAVQIDGAEPYEFIDETGSSTITLPALAPGHHTIIIEAYDEANNSIISTFSFGILAFDKPQFTEYPAEINTQVIPVIKGITRPNAKVTVSVRRVGAEALQPQVYELVSDGSGVFTFIPDSTFLTGVYELSAVAIDKNGAQSDPSDSIRIAVQEPGFIQIGSLIVSVLSVIVPLIALVILLILTLVYFFRRLRAVRTFVSAETDEALSVLAKEFTKLQTIVVEEKTKLESSRKTKKLTKTESAVLERFENALREAEQRVKKEVSDVDDIL